MGGAILAQVVARLSEDDELLKEKTIELTLDRTYNNFAAASSAVLSYGVPRFLLYYIYAQLDLNLNTEKAIAQYTAKLAKINTKMVINTTIIVSNMDEILGDHVLNFHDQSKNISMKLVDRGHNDTLRGMETIDNPDSTIKPCNRSFCYAIDAMIVLTALQFTGILGVGFALLGLGLPAILPLALYMGAMVLLMHRVYHTTVFSFALQDIYTKNNADQIKNMTYNYLRECMLFIAVFSVGVALLLTFPVSVTPLVFILGVMLPSIAILSSAHHILHRRVLNEGVHQPHPVPGKKLTSKRGDMYLSLEGSSSKAPENDSRTYKRGC